MTGISTHILDTGTGYPAAGVPVSLERQNTDGWCLVGEGITNDDGRITSLTPVEQNLEPGVYRLQFAVKRYFRQQQVKCFYPEVTVVFEVSDDRHHHIPLLLSTYGYSTYRGS
ncbi:hydroxyisourate hydrolase [Endozoicomonas gorgoniicola]|uniref:5-hydroxyisourate hydrolase n=1 Tax=Endozoicomonas gorgoniicola TaxID=1234144 RepID=A0ABT3MVR1_9GAMM|nr:hydroxyisourate hydrolase [Endozoicomonas gorgoniicola]MCW7553464.1 hydroxyisourate hydrolase [Endozoicomonas gorgoniicola]